MTILAKTKNIIEICVQDVFYSQNDIDDNFNRDFIVFELAPQSNEGSIKIIDDKNNEHLFSSWSKDEDNNNLVSVTLRLIKKNKVIRSNTMSFWGSNSNDDGYKRGLISINYYIDEEKFKSITEYMNNGINPTKFEFYPNLEKNKNFVHDGTNKIDSISYLWKIQKHDITKEINNCVEIDYLKINFNTKNLIDFPSISENEIEFKNHILTSIEKLIFYIKFISFLAAADMIIHYLK